MDRFLIAGDQTSGDLQRLFRKSPRREHPRQRRMHRSRGGRSRRLPVKRPAQQSFRTFQAAEPGTGDTQVMQDAGIVRGDAQRLFQQGCRRRLVTFLQQLGRDLVQQSRIAGMAPDQFGPHARGIGGAPGLAQSPAEQKRCPAVTGIEPQGVSERFGRFGRSARHGVAKPMQIGHGRIVRRPDASLANQPVRRRRVTRQQMGSGAVEQFRRARCCRDRSSVLVSAGQPVPVILHTTVIIRKTNFHPIKNHEILTLRIHDLAICGVLNCRCGFSGRRPRHPFPCEHCEEEQRTRCWRPAPRTIC